MKKLLAAFVVGAFAFGSLTAMAQDKTQSFILTPAEQARLKADRAEAKAKWAAMTPEQKAATRKAANAKKRSELTFAIREYMHGLGWTELEHVTEHRHASSRCGRREVVDRRAH